MADVNAPDLPPTSEIVRRRTPPLPLSHCHLLPPCHAPPPATEPLHARVCIDLSLPPRMCPRMRTGSHGFSTLCWPLLHHHNHSSPQPLPVTLQPKERVRTSPLISAITEIPQQSYPDHAAQSKAALSLPREKQSPLM